MAACGGDDYYYPSVKLEFLTAHTGADGFFDTVLTDEGRQLQVVYDASQSNYRADTLVRIVSNYERQLSSTASEGAKLYACVEAISPLPQPVHAFDKGVKTESASVQSIWMGYDYLNMLLMVNQQGRHEFRFVEESVTRPDAEGCVVVNLRLHHAVETEVEDYEKRAYVSIPLRHYVTEGVSKVTVNFTLYTEAGSNEPYVKPDSEVGANKTYSFDYVPVR